MIFKSHGVIKLSEFTGIRPGDPNYRGAWIYIPDLIRFSGEIFPLKADGFKILRRRDQIPPDPQYTEILDSLPEPMRSQLKYGQSKEGGGIEAFRLRHLGEIQMIARSRFFSPGIDELTRFDEEQFKAIYRRMIEGPASKPIILIGASTGWVKKSSYFWRHDTIGMDLREDISRLQDPSDEADLSKIRRGSK